MTGYQLTLSARLARYKARERAEMGRLLREDEKALLSLPVEAIVPPAGSNASYEPIPEVSTKDQVSTEAQ